MEPLTNLRRSAIVLAKHAIAKNSTALPPIIRSSTNGPKVAEHGLPSTTHNINRSTSPKRNRLSLAETAISKMVKADFSSHRAMKPRHRCHDSKLQTSWAAGVPTIALPMLDVTALSEEATTLENGRGSDGRLRWHASRLHETTALGRQAGGGRHSSDDRQDDCSHQLHLSGRW